MSLGQKESGQNRTESDGQRSSIGEDRGPEMKLKGEKTGLWNEMEIIERKTIESHRLHNSLS